MNFTLPQLVWWRSQKVLTVNHLIPYYDQAIRHLEV